MFRGGSPASGIAAFTGGTIQVDNGSAGAPSVAFASAATTGFFKTSTSRIGWSLGTYGGALASGGVILTSAGGLFFGSDTTEAPTLDVALSRASANSVRFSGGSASVTTTSRTELNKAVAAIANNVATDVLTVTIPNAAHSASLLVRVTSSLGAGGAIGANEATATNSYIIGITRTAGVATVATASAAFGAVAVAVAGAATVTGVATVTAMTGAVGAQQTFTVQVTVARSAGSSDNHTCLVYAQLMNANVTGITIA